MRSLICGLTAAALMAGTMAPAFAAPTGTALGVDPQAELNKRGAIRTLTVGDDIAIGDRVVTDEEGQVQILFSDNTKLVVGPRSALLIEDYLVRDNGSAGKFAIDALSGTFRFVSGNAPKDRYVINTPTGTIGVRGTAFELFVNPDSAYILMQNGATVTCPTGGGSSACTVLEGSCAYGVMSTSATEVFGHADTIIGAARDQMKEFFRYAQNQARLTKQFRLSSAERCLRRPAEGAAASSLSSPSSSPPPQPTQQTTQQTDTSLQD